MNEVLAFVIGAMIIWQGYELISKQGKMRAELKELKKTNQDLNIEFGSHTGIELVKKQYPDLELRDDKRTGIEIVEPHSIAKGMNDPSERQRAKFILENKDA